MTIHLEKEIETLKRKILALSSMVEETVYRAVKAVAECDAVTAESVVQGDDAIDAMEVEVEEDCLKALALHQPVATDLRFIVSVLKINSDLERIGDLAVNIAQRAGALSKLERIPAFLDLSGMAEKVKQMLRKSLTSLVNLDSGLARQVCASDDAIDNLNRSMHQQITEKIKSDPSHTEVFILLLSVSRNLERIADHATNIAEDVIYMNEGQIIRHGLGGLSKVF
jgi:phosphate transport system protein